MVVLGVEVFEFLEREVRDRGGVAAGVCGVGDVWEERGLDDAAVDRVRGGVDA